MMDYRILNRRPVRLFILAVVGGMLAVCASCAKPPSSTSRFHRMGGFTVWDCSEPRPVVFIEGTMATHPILLRSILAHEMSHVAVMESFGSCEAWKLWAGLPGNRAYLEALAFCAQIRQEVRDGLDPAKSEGRAAMSLSGGYDFGLSVEEARAKIRAVCR